MSEEKQEEVGKLTTSHKVIIASAIIGPILGVFIISSAFSSSGNPESTKYKTQAQQRQETPEEREAARKLQEEQKLQAQKALDEKKTALATQYCKEREDNHRMFSLSMKKDDDGGESLDVKNTKYGDALTLDDCKKGVDTILKFREEDITNISAEAKKTIDGVVWVGMSKGDLILSAGLPDDINTTTHSFGVNEQFVYRKDSYGFSSFYVYLDDYKVTSYQDF